MVDEDKIDQEIRDEYANEKIVVTRKWLVDLMGDLVAIGDNPKLATMDDLEKDEKVSKAVDKVNTALCQFPVLKKREKEDGGNEYVL